MSDDLRRLYDSGGLDLILADNECDACGAIAWQVIAAAPDWAECAVCGNAVPVVECTYGSINESGPTPGRR